MKIVDFPNIESWIDSSSKAQGVLKILDKKPRTAREISKILFISTNQTSMIIEALMGEKTNEAEKENNQNNAFIKCVTPNRKKKKIYSLTKKGKKFVKKDMNSS